MSSKVAGSSPGYRLALLADPFPLIMRAKLCLHAFHLTDPVEVVEPAVKVEFSTIDGSSPEVGSLHKFTNPLLVKWRLSQGEVCWVVKVEGEIVSYVWVAFRQEQVEELCKAVKLQEGEFYLYDAFTVPEWRGKGIYPAILSRQLQHFKEEGFKRALIFTVEENIASRRGITRSGFNHFQTIEITKILNFAFYKYDPKTPPSEAEVSFVPWKNPF